MLTGAITSKPMWWNSLGNLPRRLSCLFHWFCKAEDLKAGHKIRVTTKTEDRDVTFHNVSLQRAYKHGNEWKHTSSFGRDDLPLVQTVLQRAWEFILDTESVRGKGEVEDVSWQRLSRVFMGDKEIAMKRLLLDNQDESVKRAKG